MVISVKGISRAFEYKGNRLTDPNTKLSEREVLKFYSNTYPELTNATLYGPTIKDDLAVYEFKLSIGTKG